MSDKKDILAEKIKWMFLRRVLDDLKTERKGIHVSSLVYDCMRRAYYEYVLGEIAEAGEGESLVSTLNEDNAIVFWTGKKLHELPISNVVVNIPDSEMMRQLFEMTDEEFVAGKRLAHELPIGYRGGGKEWKVVGKLDELISTHGHIVIVDKKTTRNIPSKPYEHHMKQVRMYALMLAETYGIIASKGAILYINVGSVSSPWDQRVKVHVFDIGDLGDIRQEMELKYEVLKYALENKKVPPARPSWLCNVCPFFERCIKDGLEGEDGKEEEIKEITGGGLFGGS